MLRNNIVFLLSLLITLFFVILGLYNAALLDSVASILHDGIINYFGWIYHLAVFIFFIFCLYLAFSRFGQTKLGEDSEKPEYSYTSWFSMLFATGMGIGLVFWGVAEPLSHYLNPPAHIAQASPDAAAFAMRYSFFHWGLQPWAIYIVMSLSLAYFSYRRKMPPVISSCFYPLLGDKIYGTPGHIINTLAVVATVFGVVTTLGFGAMQIGAGLNFLYGVSESIETTFIIIAAITLAYLLSSLTGVDKGIQTLSKLNIFFALILLFFVLIVGPTTTIFNVFISTLGGYASGLLEMSLQTYPFQGYDWTISWTMFYWAWWISWSPFVGLFVARISRGRTIKEFILGVLLVPSLLTFFWFSVFGGTALHLELEKGAGLAQIAVHDVSTVLFHMFANLPLGSMLSLFAVFLLFNFVITSADSATFVLGMMTSNGNLNPATIKKIVWGLTQSILAAVLLVSGGLLALQHMAIAAALPFTIIMFFMCYTLLRGLREEK